MAEEGFALHARDYVLLKHLLTDHEHFRQVGRDSLSQPVHNLFTSTACYVLAEPPIPVILHLNIFVHCVGPLLQVLHFVVFDLRLFTTRFIVPGQATALLVFARAFFGVAALPLICDQIDDIEHLMLNIILVNEVEDLLLDDGEFGDFVY